MGSGAKEMSTPTLRIAGEEIPIQALEWVIAQYPEKLAQIHKRFATLGEYVFGHCEDFSFVIFWGPEGVRSVSSEAHEDLTTLPDSAIIIDGPQDRQCDECKRTYLVSRIHTTLCYDCFEMQQSERGNAAKAHQ